MFQQGDDEILYTAWERYKRMLKRCPMHGIDLKTQMDIVYHSLNDTSKGIIDASCYGAFKRKSAEEARDLIANLAKCNMKAPSEFTRSYNKEKGSGVIELNKMIAMEAKLDAIMHKMDKQDKKLHSTHEIGAVERGGIKRGAEGSADEDPYAVEEANYLNENSQENSRNQEKKVYKQETSAEWIILKELPCHLKYAFLEPEQGKPVIISVELTENEEQRLL